MTTAPHLDIENCDFTIKRKQDYRPRDFTSSSGIAPCIKVDHVTKNPLEDLNVHYARKVGTFFSKPQMFQQETRSGNLSSELDDIYNECSVPNWDGYGAKPAYRSVRKTVEKFLDALPVDIMDPEIGADPDGEISLDWCLAQNKMFTISIGRNNRIAYAFLDGDKRRNGLDFFKGAVPQDLIDHLNNFLDSQV